MTEFSGVWAYTPYMALIHEAESGGYDALIIDSLSHAWAGEGGILDMHDKATLASKTQNSFTAWREVTPQHNALEYEFTAVLDLSVEGHIATASKDRTRLLDGKHFVPTPETGEMLREWLDTGKDGNEESRLLLEQLKARVDEIDNIPHLNNWWRAHGTEVDRLTLADREILKIHCGTRKAAILKQPLGENAEGKRKDNSRAAA